MMLDKKNLLFCLMGPTASGKTQLAINLLKQFPFEIISVDSAMVYRGMDIGTAKPDLETLQKAPHRLIDFRDPSEAYSAAQFKADVIKEIKNIQALNRIPLLVGGTMLYFRALQQGLSEMPSANAELREQLTQRALEEGWSSLHAELLQADPTAGNRIHSNDAQRIQRALEVYLLTGRTMTSWQQTTEAEFADYRFINIAITPDDRVILHTRIAARFTQMLEDGLIEEVKVLMARGDLTLDTPAIRSVGYLQVWEYLEGKYSFDEMKEKGIIATRQLAKRQLTWLRSWPDLEWFNSEDVALTDKVTALISNHLMSKLE